MGIIKVASSANCFQPSILRYNQFPALYSRADILMFRLQSHCWKQPYSSQRFGFRYISLFQVSSNEASPQHTTPFKLQKLRQAVKQQTLHSFIKVEPKTPKVNQLPTINISEDVEEPPTVNIRDTSKNFVSRAEYEAMRSRVDNLEMDVIKLQSMADNLDFETLPDKGLMIKNRLRFVENNYH